MVLVLIFFLLPMQEIHARLEPLMLFTIDGANFIEKDDSKWEVVLAVMEKPTGQMLVSCCNPSWQAVCTILLVQCKSGHVRMPQAVPSLLIPLNRSRSEHGAIEANCEHILCQVDCALLALGQK
jgi:hypothetical protein